MIARRYSGSVHGSGPSSTDVPSASSSRSVAWVISWTASSNAAWLRAEGARNPETLRTYWSAAAEASPVVAAPSDFRRMRMLRHMPVRYAEMARVHHRRRLAIRIAAATLLGILLAFGIDMARVGGLDAWLAIRGWSPPYDAKGTLYETADGRKVYLDCRGAGSPTVILEAGMGSGASGWGFVLPRVAERTRVCAHDRPGLGRSSRRGPHTVGEQVSELRAVLAQAGESGPFIVVGHSLGGVYARVFAARFRSETVGVVLVDAYYPDGTWAKAAGADAGWQAQVAEEIAGTNRMIEGVEELRWPPSRAELDDSRLDGLPLEVLAVDQHLRYDDPRIPPEMEERLIAAWRAWCLALAPGSTTITIADRSGHLIQYDRPDLVIAAVDRLLAGARR